MARFTKPKKTSSSSAFTTVSRKKSGKGAVDRKIEKAKHTFTPPGKNELCAQFEQSYLAHPQRAVIVHMCNECIEASVACKKEIKRGERNGLVLLLCRTCVFANRRCAQTLYFNTTLKNKHDRGDEDEEGSAGSGDNSGDDGEDEGDSGSDDDDIENTSAKKSRVQEETMPIE